MCVFQEKMLTRITLMYQVDVCVCKEKDLRQRAWSMCVCVHVCVKKRTFHVCVFQEKRITRITLVYQVDVCVDGCVRKRT